MQEGGHAWQDVPPSEQRLPMLHKLGHGMLAISDALLQLSCDQGDCFRLVQLHAAREALLREETRLAVRGVAVRPGPDRFNTYSDIPDATKASPPPLVRYAWFLGCADQHLRHRGRVRPRKRLCQSRCPLGVQLEMVEDKAGSLRAALLRRPSCN